MTSDPQSAVPEAMPELVDLDELLRGVPPLSSPHEWAMPGIIPDDEEFDEFVAWLRAQRRRDFV